MGISFVTRKYTCQDCGKHGSIYSAIKKITDIYSYFPEDSRPSELSENKLYIEIIERDSYGILVKREAVEAVCEHCGSSNYTPEVIQNFENVLNFYPPCEAAKWYNGFSK